MAANTQFFRNAYVWLDSNDFSAQTEEVALNYKSEMLDRTAMGDTTRNRRGGLFDWSVEVKFRQSFVGSSVDSVLFAMVGTSVAIELRPDNSCSTAINPRYSGVGILESYTPLSGAVGTLLPAPVTFNSVNALTRASSS